MKSEATHSFGSKAVALTLAVQLLGLYGCGENTKTRAIEDEINLQKATLAALKDQVDTLQKERTAWLIDSISAKAVYLTPGQQGYAPAQADFGRVMVEIVDVQPYANGSRVTLRIGNMSSATALGVVARAEWGPLDEKGLPIDSQQRRVEEVKLAATLPWGTWTNSVITLEGVSPAKLGYIRLTHLSHKSIVLR